MTAPLSTFMTKLLDESINRQDASTAAAQQLYNESTSFSTTSTIVSINSSDSTVMTENRSEQSSANTGAIIRPTAPVTPRISVDEPAPAKTPFSFTPVPNRLALRICRKSFTAVGNNGSPLKMSPTSADDVSLTMSAALGKRQSSSNNFLSSGTATTSGNEYSSSLTNFMNQLLNDSDIDKLIQQTEEEETVSVEEASSKKFASDNNTAERGELSKGAANVLASAVHVMQRESRNVRHQKELNYTEEDSAVDADVENSQPSLSTGKHRRPSNKHHPNNQLQQPGKRQQNTATGRSRVAEAQDCLESMAKIEALLHSSDSTPPDPYSLEKTMAKSGEKNRKEGSPRSVLARANSDTSISLTSEAKLQASSNQSLSIAALRQELKKSSSVSNLRQEMTRLQSRENIYACSMELDYFDDDAKDDNQASQGAGAKTPSSRRPRSNTPRSRRDKASTSKQQRRAMSASTQDTKRRRNPETPRSASPRKRSSSTSDAVKTRRGRTPNACRRTPSKEVGHRSRPSSNNKKRPTSAQRCSPSVTTTPRTPMKKRSASVTPSRRGLSKTPTRRRKSTIDGPTSKRAMEDVSKQSTGDGPAKLPLEDGSSKRRMEDGSSKRIMSDGSSRRIMSDGSTNRMRDGSSKRMGDASMKHDKSKSRRRRGSAMDGSSRRDHSNDGSSRRKLAGDGPPSSPKVKSSRARSITGGRRASTTDGGAPKTPSARNKRASVTAAGRASRSPSVARASRRSTSKEAPKTPRTPKTHKTPSASTGKSSSRKDKPSTTTRSKSVSAEGPTRKKQSAPKQKLRRAKTTDQLPTPAGREESHSNEKTTSATENATPARRRNSLTSTTGEPKQNETAQPTNVSNKGPVFRRTRTVEPTDNITPMTPSARRRKSLTAACLPGTPRRPKESTSSKEPRTPRKSVVNTSQPPRRQQSDPVSSVRVPQAALVAEEAAIVAKEMDQGKQRVRSKSVDPHPFRKSHSVMDVQQSSKPTSRRGASQRSNQKAQQALQRALTEEVKAKEANDAKLEETPPEGVKEATWIARRKSRLSLPQQSQPRRISVSGAQ